ncbi:MAG: GTP-binding protein [Eubacteriales bacterium]|nr:GTP-binding protein [Eubacteriales bacterium]
MDIPVYLIAGFLDAGKTNFINGILQDGFARDDRTLLICCEEGEEEYDRKAHSNVFTYTIEDPEDMTPELFKKLEKQYKPKQVIIEYNGMWMIEPLYREGLPANWILYQIMCLVDATTFEMYVKNMGQLMMEKITNADMLIFNRCNEELRAQLRSRNLRMVNRRADIFLENADGTSEEYVTDDMAPFDLSGGKLAVPDDDYGIWYVDLMDNPDRYEGMTVTFKGLMCHSKKFKGIHCPGRFAMVCCENDMQFLALVCKGEGMEKYKDREWVEVTATVKKEQSTAYDGEGPVLYVTELHKCEKPKNEVVSF